MSILEKPSSSISSSSSSSLSLSVPLSAVAGRDVDPLLKDLNEKKQSFRRNVVSLAAELKELRGRLASQEQSFAKETLTRKEAELKAKSMEMEIGMLQKKLHERNEQLQHLKDLDDLRAQLSEARARADASDASAKSAHLQCFELLKELNEKNTSLREHEDCVNRLVQQLHNLEKDFLARESSQKQLKDDALRVEHDIMEALAKAGETKDSSVRKILEEACPKNFDKMNKLLVAKDEEIAKLKDEIKIMSAHWKLKTMELESQLEKQRHTDQELKKRVLKLEFCLQEERSQTRKLKRVGERRDKDIKELKDQLAAKQQRGDEALQKHYSFWETSAFKIVVSMSMMILMVFSKR